MPLLPERLVTVNRFGSPELAASDLRKLQKAGLDAYAGGSYFRRHGNVDLLVPESQVSRALEILGLDAPEAAPDASSSPRFVCPDCGSADSYRIPPYAFYALVASVVVAIGTAIVGKAWIGAAGLMVGWIVATALSRHSGKYRCRQCRREWRAQ